MTTLLTKELIERCHAGSRAKGFWDTTPDMSQQLMLVVSELAESLEAHRKGRTCKGQFIYQDRDNAFFKMAFEETVKDTVEDELADAYIRILDFIGGFELDKGAVLTAPKQPGHLPANYGAALLQITSWIVAASENELAREWYLVDAIRTIEALAAREGIDLATHIDLKLRFNATRPARHGKAY